MCSIGRQVNHLDSKVSRWSLVAHSESGCVYLVPRDSIQDARRHGGSSGGSSTDFDTEPVIDLRTSARKSIRSGDLEGFEVQDSDVGRLLNEYSASGIRRPFLARPLGYLPLYGNLSSPREATVTVGGSCNSHCTFCYTEWLRSEPDLETNEILRSLEAISCIKSVETLVFSGGEATIRKNLPQLFRYAKTLGFKNIALQTNGRTLSRPAALDELLDAGLTAILLSLHGATPVVHDNITKTKDGFIHAVAALHLLCEREIATTVNTVVCRENIAELPHFPEAFESRGIKFSNWRISYPIIEGAAFDNRSTLLVKFSEFRDALRSAFLEATRTQQRVQTGPMPLCMSPSIELANTYRVEALKSSIQVSPFYKQNVPRGEVSIKLRVCQSCSLRFECRGIQVEYLKVFPDSHTDFIPIPQATYEAAQRSDSYQDQVVTKVRG